MNRRRHLFRYITWHSLVRGLCALSLVLAVFAHRPASPIDGTQAVFSADADSLFICAPSPEAPAHPAKATRDCEFCRIVASSLLPVPERIADVRYRIVGRFAFFAVPDAPGKPAFRPASPLRGPPLA